MQNEVMWKEDMPLIKILGWDNVSKSLQTVCRVFYGWSSIWSLSEDASKPFWTSTWKREQKIDQDSTVRDNRPTL